MKKNYEKPVCDVAIFDEKDLLNLSTGDSLSNNNVPGTDFGGGADTPGWIW